MFSSLTKFFVYEKPLFPIWKKRLEILQRLSKKRSYCHELADQMGLDPGHMSRNLSVLHSYGFLRQERESLKNYYRTDPEAIRNFLKVVETTILG